MPQRIDLPRCFQTESEKYKRYTQKNIHYPTWRITHISHKKKEFAYYLLAE